ncbi:unnamed protein product [Spirodela intermedia]|uniref:Uncharacterized protein n=1 Tax=Spirodela intermedia TaxID=51605 RepID=A0A7I8JIL3_SPIIN|nr:unnamed protein product [Spirodela intermedia]CAA6669986.1 unnamed protein product [Spirodela intermedia]
MRLLFTVAPNKVQSLGEYFGISTSFPTAAENGMRGRDTAAAIHRLRRVEWVLKLDNVAGIRVVEGVVERRSRACLRLALEIDLMKAALRETVRRLEVDTSGRGGMVVRDVQVESVADGEQMTDELVRRADMATTHCQLMRILSGEFVRHKGHYDTVRKFGLDPEIGSIDIDQLVKRYP